MIDNKTYEDGVHDLAKIIKKMIVIDIAEIDDIYKLVSALVETPQKEKGFNPWQE